MTEEPGSLICRDTGSHFPLGEPVWRSPATGGLLDLHWPSSFPIDLIKQRPLTLWRYRDALPIRHDASIVSLGEGVTPLHARSVAGRAVLLKLDTRFASGSYKDRGAAVVVSHCREIGITHVVEDSSGNAGAAFAMYCAAAAIACDIYVPASASPQKLIQVEASGATLVRVPGTRQDTSDAVWAAAQNTYYASHSWNPFFFHGTKTFAFEVVEQLGWRSPAAVVIPTGNGTLLLGAAIGFEEMRRAGIIDRVPRLFAVQSAACAPLAHAWELNAASISPCSAAHTVAEGIAIPNPVRAAQCLEVVRASGGGFITVSEAQIFAELRLAVGSGLFIEPTSASALAAVGALPEIDGDIVVAITGHGLKCADKISHLLRAHA